MHLKRKPKKVRPTKNRIKAITILKELKKLHKTSGNSHTENELNEAINLLE